MALPISITLPLMTIILLLITLTLTPLSLLASSPTTPTETLTNTINSKHIKTTTLKLQNEQLKAAISALINLKTNLPSLKNLHVPVDEGTLSVLNNLTFYGFTILAPPASAFFNAAPPTYLYCLRAHLVLHSHTFENLKNITRLSPDPKILTLIPEGESISYSPSEDTVIIDGVRRINSPDLFVHPKLVVHGIDGILPSAVEYCNYDDVTVYCPLDGDDEDYQVSPLDGRCYKRASASEYFDLLAQQAANKEEL